MEQLPPIILYKGATSVIDLDLSEFDMQEGHVLLIMCDRGSGAAIGEWRFDTQGVHQIVLDDDFTATLEISDHRYEYGIVWILPGGRRPKCAPSRVEVKRIVGGYPHGSED